MTAVGIEPNSVLLFAMEGLFSRRVFELLLQQGAQFEGVVLPGRSSITHKEVSHNKLNVLNTESIESLARYHRIPLFYINGKTPEHYQQLLQKKHPDIILVACFPYLLPAAVFKCAQRGAFNIHPSLLPAYKGPVPLFWQFYFGDMKCGISIHEIDATFDTGNIVLQQTVNLVDGISSAEATDLLANAAVDLVALLFEQLCADRLQSIVQDEKHASYYSWPGLAQFTIPTSWAARRAFNFMHGSRHWNQVYRIVADHDDKGINAREAIAYYPAHCSAVTIHPEGTQQLIQFKEGCLLISP